MAQASTEEDDFTRHVSKDTLDSLNLKAENNLNEYIVLCVNIDDQSELFKSLSMIISEDRIMMVNDIDSSLSYIHSLSNTKTYLIVSGTLGQIHIDQFVNNPQIISIYVYCKNTDKHRLWTKEIEKIRCTVSNMEELIIRLHRDIKQLSGRWPFEEKSFQKALTSISQWYGLFLLVVSHHPQSFEKSYHKMFNECRAYYKKNDRMLKRIDQLAQTYKADDAIREYTQDGLLYRIINHALRTQNMETIRKFSPYITDLHYQLHEYHRKYYRSNEQYIRSVYRGQYLNSDELEYISSICKSRNPLIKLTTFTSASLNPEVALQFALPSLGHIPCLFEIIITNEYNSKYESFSSFQQVFADISSLSFMPFEQEVLFSLVTHFRVKYVGDSAVQSHRSWVPIVLELVINKEKINFIYFDIVKRIEDVTNPQIYSDILDILQVNATDEQRFNNINWQKCWNKFTALWATDIPHEQPLLLTIYDCFTEDKYYLRKAIQMHKDIIHLNLHPLLNSSSFSDLLKNFKQDQDIPTKGTELPTGHFFPAWPDLWPGLV